MAGASALKATWEMVVGMPFGPKSAVPILCKIQGDGLVWFGESRGF